MLLRIMFILFSRMSSMLSAYYTAYNFELLSTEFYRRWMPSSSTGYTCHTAMSLAEAYRVAWLHNATSTMTGQDFQDITLQIVQHGSCNHHDAAIRRTAVDNVTIDDVYDTSAHQQHLATRCHLR